MQAAARGVRRLCCARGNAAHHISARAQKAKVNEARCARSTEPRKRSRQSAARCGAAARRRCGARVIGVPRTQTIDIEPAPPPSAGRLPSRLRRAPSPAPPATRALYAMCKIEEAWCSGRGIQVQHMRQVAGGISTQQAGRQTGGAGRHSGMQAEYLGMHCQYHCTQQACTGTRHMSKGVYERINTGTGRK